MTAYGPEKKANRESTTKFGRDIIAKSPWIKPHEENK
jgi:hypothetical protein